MAKSLVVVADDVEATASRYRMLETIRDFAALSLGRAEETAGARDAHLRFCLTSAQQARSHRADAGGARLPSEPGTGRAQRAATRVGLGEETFNAVWAEGERLALEHLSHIYAKLDLANRAQLTAEVTRRQV